MRESESILILQKKLEQIITKYVAQCGNAAVVKHFANKFPTLGESTVC